MIKYIMLLTLCLVWAVPCMAGDGTLTDAYREVYEQSQRVRERNQDVIMNTRETERRQQEWEREYEGDKNDAEWYYNVDTDTYYWEYNNGMIIEGD